LIIKKGRVGGRAALLLPDNVVASQGGVVVKRAGEQGKKGWRKKEGP